MICLELSLGADWGEELDEKISAGISEQLTALTNLEKQLK
jgi:hypothetical protein